METTGRKILATNSFPIVFCYVGFPNEMVMQGSCQELVAGYFCCLFKKVLLSIVEKMFPKLLKPLSKFILFWEFPFHKYWETSSR